ncbi:COR domain-containing protein [Geodermatophilus telluris]|nr:COR domain-containing protein [Geodermatophilus telluris]
MLSQDARYFDQARDEIARVAQTRGTSLRLAGRGLRAIPPEIGDLVALRELDLRSNLLTELPASIGRLVNLRELHLDANRLKALPEEIVGLRKLQHLGVSSNRLESLPERVGSLTALKSLHLRGNQLTVLPRSLGRLDLNRGGGLLLEGNPFKDPLPSLIASGITNLLTYLRSLDDGEPQYEAKLLLVGEGEVGKSSLLARMRGESFIEGRSTTHGIEIRRLELDHPSLVGSQIVLNAWDFGGQEIYRITHQFFFSRRCMYLVVWNPRQGREANEVEDWVRRIRLRVGEDAKVLIVATHSDIRRPELDYNSLRSRFPTIIVGNHAIDSKSGSGLQELRSSLAQESSLLPQMGELLSRKWALARQEILGLPEPQISHFEFSTVAIKHGLGIDETTALAALLHDLGHIVHYGDDAGLKDIVVLQPEWLTKAIGYVLEDVGTREAGGILDHTRLREIWQSAEDDYPERYYPYFLRLMEKFDVSYRLPNTHASLIGQLVPYERPEIPWMQDGDANRRLSLVCVMNEEAPGLIAWLTVRNNRFSAGVHWRKGVFFRHQAYASEALLEITAERTLLLDVRAPSPDYFFSVLRDGIEDLIAARWPGLQYQLLIPCPGTNGRHPCGGQFSFRTLQRYRERQRATIDCQECLESQDVTRLLTGFEAPRVSLQDSLDKLHIDHARVLAGLGRLEAYAADAARQIRVVLKAIASESGECPRLFTMEETQQTSITNWWKTTFSLTLWCEHPGGEHSWPAATYEVHRPNEWVQQIAPYGLLVAKTLKLLVPFASTAISDVFDADDAERVNRHLAMMKDLAGEVNELGDSRDALGGGSGTKISVAEGAALRALATFLNEEDVSQGWGGLRRRMTSSGDFVWICPRHYGLYDPGLPELPAQL